MGLLAQAFRRCSFHPVHMGSIATLFLILQSWVCVSFGADNAIHSIPNFDQYPVNPVIGSLFVLQENSVLSSAEQTEISAPLRRQFFGVDARQNEDIQAIREHLQSNPSALNETVQNLKLVHEFLSTLTAEQITSMPPSEQYRTGHQLADIVQRACSGITGSDERSRVADTKELSSTGITVTRGNDVDARQVSDILSEYRKLRLLTTTALQAPKQLTIHVMAQNDPKNFINGNPQYSHDDLTVQLPYEMKRRDGSLVEPSTAKAVRLHELTHALVDATWDAAPPFQELASLIKETRKHEDAMSQIGDQLSQAKASAPQDASLIQQLQRELSDAEVRWFNAQNTQRNSAAGFLISAFDELLADIAAVMIVGDPKAISKGLDAREDNRIARDFSHPVGIMDLPADSPKGGYRHEIAFDEKGLLKSDTYYPPQWLFTYGLEPHSHFDAVRYFIWKNILTSPAAVQWPSVAFARIAKILAAEMSERHAAPGLDFFALSPRASNERLIDKLKREFADPNHVESEPGKIVSPSS